MDVSVTLKDLGLEGKPNEGIYKNLMKFSNFLLNTVLVNTFEMTGEENLREDCYQIFLCNHLYYTDPVLAQMAIVLATQNDKPIPAPAYKTYVKDKYLGPIMVSLFSFPIYGKEDGYGEREKSLQYCFQCFLRQERILIFPEGQIAHDGEFIAGKFGAAEIAWRAYHALNDFKKGKNDHKIKIIPTNISYYPTAGVPLGDMSKISVRFGKAIDVKKELIDRFYSPRYMFNDETKLKRALQKKLMHKVTKEIGSLTTININNIISWVIHYMVEKNCFMVDKYEFDNMIFDIVDRIKEKEGIHLINHLRDCDLTLRAYDVFMEHLFHENIIARHISRRREEILGFNLNYILKKHEFKDVRDKNIILYNRNLIEHINDFKKIARKVVNKEL